MDTNMNNQIVPSARDPRSEDEDENDADKLEHIVSNVGMLSRRQAHLADMQVQAIHAAKGYIDERVSSAEEQARCHAEILGHLLTQVQVDHHVLKEHLSIYLQGIADSARQQIKGVYEDLQSRHVISLQTYDQRVFEIDKETRATKDAVKANDESVRRVLANQSRIDALEQELKDALRIIENQASSLVLLVRRVGSLEEQITASNGLETRVFERVDKLLATAQLTTASSVARLSGRMDRYDDRTVRTTTRLDQLVGDAMTELKRTIEVESKGHKASISKVESQLESSTISIARFDEALSSMKQSTAAQGDELLAIQTHVAQLVASQLRDAVPGKIEEHTQQIAAIHRELENVERESLIGDAAQANTNQAVRNLTATQEQQRVMIQQLHSQMSQLPPMATPLAPQAVPFTCEQHHSLKARVEQLAELILRQQASQHAMEARLIHLSHTPQAQAWEASADPAVREGTHSIEARLAQLTGLVGQQQDSHLAMQAKIDKLDISIEDRVEAWFNHAQSVQDVRLNALYERDDTSVSSTSDEEPNSDEMSDHSAPGVAERVELSFAAGGDRRLNGTTDIEQGAAESAGATEDRLPRRNRQSRRGLHSTGRAAQQGVDDVARLGGDNRQADERHETQPRHWGRAQTVYASEPLRRAAPTPAAQTVAPRVRSVPQRTMGSWAGHRATATDSADDQPVTPPESPPVTHRRPLQQTRRTAAADSADERPAPPPETLSETRTARRRVPQQSHGDDQPATSPEAPNARRRTAQHARTSEAVRRVSPDEGQWADTRRAELRRAAREAAQEVFAEHNGLGLGAPTSQGREQRYQRLELAEREDQAVREAARDQALRAIEELVAEQDVDRRTGQAQPPPRRDRNLRARLAARESTRRSTSRHPSQPATNGTRTTRGRTPQAEAPSSRRRNRSPATRNMSVNDARASAQDEIRRRADERAHGLSNR